METTYYIYGARPVIEEKDGEIWTYYSFQWKTGEFKEDMSYMRLIFHDLSGDAEEIDKEKFDSIVKNLRDKLQ